MQLRTLGGLALEDDDFSRPKPLLLLAYLALEGAKSRRFISELFFPDAADPSDALSTTLRRLRSAGALQYTRELVRPQVACDARALLDLLDAGATERALPLYRGAFMGDVNLVIGPELEEWVFYTREFIAQRVRKALLRTAEAAMIAGDERAAVARAERAYLVDGATEPGPDDLLKFLRIFQKVHSTVAQSVRETAEAYDIGNERVTMGAEQQRAGRPPLPIPPTSLIGRDEELVNIARLLGTRECRLLTLHGPAGVGKSRLALQAASDQLATGEFNGGVVFVPTESLGDGDQLLSAIAHQLAGPAAADDPWQAIAASIGDDSVLIVLDSFEHLTATARVLRKILTTYPGVKLLVTSRIRVNLVEEWVMPVGGLRLPDDGLDWEDASLSEAIQLFLRRVQSADVRFQPDPADLPLIRRICAAVDGFPLGIELAARCTRSMPLDDLAKGLEQDLKTLAANALDGASRHPSVWGALEHSWNLISRAERDALARLSVFHGGFRREAASHVAGATIPVLMRLVDASLVRMDPRGRFAQHALSKQFAREKLQALSGEFESTAVKHAEYYARLLAETSRDTGPEDLHATLRLLEEEEQNILACLDTAASHHRYDLLLTLSEPLLWYFPMSGRFAAGSRVLASALDRLERPPAVPPTDPLQAHEAKASLLLGRAWLARYAGSLDEAGRLSAEATSHARAAGSPPQLLRSLDLGGQVLTYQGAFPDARAQLVEGVSVARDLGDQLPLSRVLCNLALVESITGHYPAAGELLDEAMEPFDAGRLPHGIDTVAILLARGVSCWCQGAYAPAAGVFREAIVMAKALSYFGPVPVLHALLAAAELSLLERGAGDDDRYGGRSSGDGTRGTEGTGNDASEATRLVEEGLVMVAQSRESMATSLLLGVESALRLRDGAVAQAISKARESYAAARAAGNAVIMLWSLPNLIAAYHQAGEHARALDLARHLKMHAACAHWLRLEATRWEEMLSSDQELLTGQEPRGTAVQAGPTRPGEFPPGQAVTPAMGPLDELVGRLQPAGSTEPS